jgi:hypothetical protein
MLITAGQDKIAHTGKSHDCGWLCTKLGGKAGCFGQAARDKAGAGIITKGLTSSNASSNGDDIFDSASKGCPYDVIPVINA